MRVTVLMIFSTFFFQPEDGIRDADVTGVQTCALPIYLPAADIQPGLRLRGEPDERHGLDPGAVRISGAQPGRGEHTLQVRDRPVLAGSAWCTPLQIGRASCREGV